MRIAVISESPLSAANGVSTSVRQVVTHLVHAGHEVQVHAPGYQGEPLPAPVFTYPAVPVPRVRAFPVGVPTAALRRRLKDFRSDVAHVASPFAFGWAGAHAAGALGVPTVAVYQTDVAAFAPHYRLGALVEPAWAVTRKIHSSCTRTLAPTTASAAELTARGIPNVHLWGRGVDLDLFHPRRRDMALRARWGRGKLLVGYVGRLAPEKNLGALREIAEDPRVQLVLIGDGPQRAQLRRRFPQAIVTGTLAGTALATAYASLDVFVHPGPNETFCQTIQEAHASGVPTVAVAAGGPRELIQHGVNGYLLPPGNLAGGLPAAVQAASLLTGVQATVQDRSWGAVCRELEHHYRAAINEHHRARSERYGEEAPAR